MTKKKATEKEETGTSVPPGQEVTNWEEQMAAEAKAIAKTERPSVNKIGFKSGVMTYMSNPVPDNALDCIVVASMQEHVFYTEKWSANEVKPPACFALGLPGDRMRPHEVVQDPPGAACDECPMFKWGSDLEGGRGKACSERRRLAIIPAFDKVDEIAESELAIMSIPVMSVKNWANYVNKLSAMTQRPPWGAITRVKLVPDAKSQFKVVFELIESVDSDALPHIHGRIQMAVNALSTPYEMNPSEEEQETGADNKKY